MNKIFGKTCFAIIATLFSAQNEVESFPNICKGCWYAVPNSNLSSVYQTPNPGPWAMQDGIMSSYNGAAYDLKRNRLVIAGGGGWYMYAGNEVYAFSLDSLKWSRIKDAASVVDDADTVSAFYYNGGAQPDSQQPRPGYTFDAIEYDSTTDKVFILGVAKTYPHGRTFSNIHALGMGNLTWSQAGHVSSDNSFGGSVSARDPVTGKIWFFGNGYYPVLSALYPPTGQYVNYGHPWMVGAALPSFQTAAIMPSTGRLISLGGHDARYWDISDTTGPILNYALSTTGCDSLVNAKGPGLQWSSVDRKLIGWAGGGHVIAMDSSYACQDIAPADSNTVIPVAPNDPGTYGRWQYIEKYNVFLLVNSTTGSVYFYRPFDPSEGTVAQPPRVEIVSPNNGAYFNTSPISIQWTIDSVTQSTQITETLTEGMNRVIRAASNAHGFGADTVQVVFDTVRPQITLNIGNPDGRHGWYRNPIQTQFFCTDNWAMAYCPPPMVLGSQGKNLVISGQARDSAGNTATVSATVKRDTIPPLISVIRQTQTPLSQGAWVTMDFRLTDTLSGIDSLLCQGQSLSRQKDSALFSAFLPAGSQTLSCSATDSAGNVSSQAWVVQVLSNQIPVAVRDSFALFANDSLRVAAPGVLDNDNDADGDSLRVFMAQNPVHGSAVLGMDGSLSYRPNLNFAGMDSLAYRVTDGKDTSAMAWVRLNVVYVPLTVHVTSPAQNLLTNSTSITVNYTINGLGYSRSFALAEGNNRLIVDSLDAWGLRYADTVLVRKDGIAPLVSIQAPTSGTLTNQRLVQVIWSVDGITQTTQLAESLTVEGENTIRRFALDSAGNRGEDSVQILRDTQPPQIVITSPYEGQWIFDHRISVNWSVDGVEQMPTEDTLGIGFNFITRTFQDSNGQIGKATVTVIHDLQNYGNSIYAQVTPSNGPAPLAVNFTGWSSNPHGQYRHRYDFDGDGVFDTTISIVEDTLTLNHFNFETGLSGWAPGGIHGSLAIAHGGTRIHSPAANPIWSTNSGAQYTNGMNTAITSPEISIPATSSCQLSWNQSFQSEQGYDFGYVQIEDANGNYNTLQSFDGSRGQSREVLDLTPYAGETIRLRYVFVSDGSVVDSGWNLNNIQVRTFDSGDSQTVFSELADGPLTWSEAPIGSGWVAKTDGNTAQYGIDSLWLESDTSSYAYGQNQNAWILSPRMALPDSGRLGLTFWQYLDVPDLGDGGVIEIAVNHGPFQILQPVGGYPDSIDNQGPGFSLNQLGFSVPSFDLTPYAGDTIQIRLHFYSNASDSSRGWLVDNIHLFKLRDGLIYGVSHVAHTYTTPGLYPAVFEVENGLGERTRADIRNTTVRVGPQGSPSITIERPRQGLLTNQTQIPVSWSVNGIAQTAQTTEELAQEGLNIITRSATDANGNSSSASIDVFRDTQPPFVSINWPTTGTITGRSQVQWWGYTEDRGSVSGVQNLTEGLNWLVLSGYDVAGNFAVDSVQILRDSRTDWLTITSPSEGDTLSIDEISVAYTLYDRPAVPETRYLNPGWNEIIVDAANFDGDMAHDTVHVFFKGCRTVRNSTLEINQVDSLACLDIKAGGWVYAHRHLKVDSLFVESGGTLVTDDTLSVGTAIINGGGMISQSRNLDSNSLYRVFILARKLTVEDGGEINVSGLGYPGAFGPSGHMKATWNNAGSHGGYGSNPAVEVYGNYQYPDLPGTGGNDWFSGTGGGRVRIVSDTLVLDGAIRADGIAQSYGSGSGGSIWIQTHAWTGSGILSAKGGTDYSLGGGGRIAVHLDSLADGLFEKMFASGYGGGTIYLESHSGERMLRIDSGFGGYTKVSVNASDSALAMTLNRGAKVQIPDQARIKELVLRDSASLFALGRWRANKVLQLAGTLEVSDTSRIDTLLLDGQSVLTHPAGRGDTTWKVILISDTVHIASQASIDVSGKGYPVGVGPNGSRNGSVYVGGTHATKGVNSSVLPYDDYWTPSLSGGGGGDVYFGYMDVGTPGGGVIQIQAHRLTLNGSLLADGLSNGDEWNQGTGAGGAVWIQADSISGTGLISASGGLGGYPGGGGRVAVYSCQISQTIRDSIRVNGLSPGSLYLACFDLPHVKILQPVNHAIVYSNRIPLLWQVDGRMQPTDSISLIEGWNTLTKCYTNQAGHTGCDTVQVRFDANPPLVEITSPLNGSYTTNRTINVTWVVDNVEQQGQRTQNLSEGKNRIVRLFTDSSGSSGADTIFVTLDTKKPIITLLSPEQASVIVAQEAIIHWSIDSVEQEPMNYAMDTSRANVVKLLAIDSAGNRDSLNVFLYSGIPVPNILGLSYFNAESLLVQSRLIASGSWVDNDSLPTGTVFSQMPSPEDSLRLHFPVKYQIARGLDAVDLIPITLNADSIAVNPLTLAATGFAKISIANLGRTEVSDSFVTLVFEDRNLDQVYTAGLDFPLGQATSGIALGSTDTMTMNIAINGALTFNGNRICALVDYMNSIGEVNENNNMINSMAQCKKRPITINYTPELKWAWVDSLHSASGSVQQAPLVANLSDDNGDGKINQFDIPEIIVFNNRYSSNRGDIVALDGRDGHKLWEKEHLDPDGWVSGATGDLDGDGLPEIVFAQLNVSQESKRILVIDHNGIKKDSSEWMHIGLNYRYFFESVTLGDLDGDGYSEIFLGSVVFDHHGQILKTKGSNGNHVGSAIADLNGDGFQEIIKYSNSDLSAYYFNNNNLVIRRPELWSDCPPKIAGFGLDKNPSILSSCNERQYASTPFRDSLGSVQVFDFQLQQIKYLPSDPFKANGYGPAMAVARDNPIFGNDSNLYSYSIGNISATVLNDPAHAVNLPYFSRTNINTGAITHKIIYGRPSGYTGNEGRGTVFDLNDDGSPEIVLKTYDSLYIMDSSGAVLSQIHSPLFNNVGVTIADVDRDGHVDIVLGADNYLDPARPIISVYSNPTWVGARSIYHQSDYTVTNINDDGTIPRFPSPSWKANNTHNVQCTEGHYACVDISASYPQLTVDSLNQDQISARIGNGGALELKAGIPVSFYASHLGNENFLATLYTPKRLASGEYATLSVPLPSAMRGQYAFRIVADDSGNGQGDLDESNENNNAVVLNFLVHNKNPVVAAIDPQFVEQNEDFTLQVEATDADTDSLHYYLSHAPAGMTVDAQTGALHWLPDQDVPRCTVTVVVRDPFQGRDSTSFLVYMGNRDNQPPVIHSTPGGLASLNTISSVHINQYFYIVNATDPEGEGLEYEAHCLSCGNGSGPIPHLNGHTFSWVPFQPPWHNGDSVRMELKVTDLRGGYTTQAFTIRLQRGSNVAPTFIAQPNTEAVEDMPWSTSLAVLDMDDDPVQILLATLPPGMTYSHDSLHWIPTSPQVPNSVRVGATDGVDTTWRNFTVHISSRNDAPRITSTPPMTGILGSTYAYPLTAYDEDGDALSYSLLTRPSGMSVNSAGVVQWSIPLGQNSPTSVDVLVEDNQGGSAHQIWQIQALPDQQAPAVAIAFSRHPVRPGQSVTVHVQANDNVGVTALSLNQNGQAVTLQQGDFVFTPADTGHIAFTAQAEDAAGNIGVATRLLEVNTHADDMPPLVTLSHSPANPQAGQTLTFTVNASDDNALDTSRLWVDFNGQSLPVQNGLVSFAALRPGSFSARAIAQDVEGNIGMAQEAVTVTPLANDTTLPLAEITSPEEDQVVYGQADLIGSAMDAHFGYYTLSHRDISTQNWVEYARSATPVQNGLLGKVDATTLINGDYEIRLDVYDLAGNSRSHSVQVTIAGERKIGPFSLTFQDLTVPMAGLDLTLSRTYDSRDKSRGDFGIGWKMGLRSIRLHESRNLGTEWAIHRTPGFIPQYSLQESKSHTVTLTLPGGRKQEFIAEPHFYSPFDPSQGELQFKAKAGTYGQLEAVGKGYFLVMGGELYDGNGDFEEPFNPHLYKLTLLDGSYFLYDQNQGGVIESGDSHGNKLLWQNGQLRHSANTGLGFVRDGEGRILSASDGAGRSVQYRYDVLGNLSEFTDANGHATRFKYGPNSYLTEIDDARGVKAARTEYDADGRVIRQINAQGDTLHLFHDLAQQREEVQDFNGHSTSYTYDSLGNVLSKTDDAGFTWRYTYDSVGNLLSTLNPGGTSRSSTYDAKGNELTSTDEMQHVTSRTYNAQGKVLTSTDALGRVTRFQYDGVGNLLKETGPDGSVQSLRTYDAQGNVLSEEDALHHVSTHTYTPQGWLLTSTDALERITSFGHDAAGNVVREINAQGDTTRNRYDANGNRVLSVNASGDSVKTEYNAINKVTRQIDALGHATQTHYNALGDKDFVIAADSAVTHYSYDNQGNLASTTDPLGRITQMRYDADNRLTRTILSDGSVQNTTYDALGRRIRSVDANQHETRYFYDDAGRNTLVRDALGHETQFEYDAAGRKTAMIDALERRTQYTYDAYDRLILTTFHNGSTKALHYDAAGRKIREVDAENHETRFEYDAVGQLTAVVDALSHRTEYSYDLNGNRLTQKDANNHTTAMGYDLLNRQTSKTYPNGDQERWTYDVNGNMLSHVKGLDSIAYAYDAMNREVHRRYFPSGHEVATHYTLDGKRDSVIDYRGVTTFAYDIRGRIELETQPNGAFIQNQYDAQGNRTSLVTPFGETLYGYDELNRMDSVISPQGQVTRYFYNVVGNRDSIAHGNGVSSAYSYDNLNRLIEVRNRNGSGLISRYTYTLNLAGIKTAIDELDGSHVQYSYDNLYRLRNEARTGSQAYTIGYTYDDVGNRLTQVKNGISTTYTYNNRDQLLSESGSAGSVGYSYDLAGRQISKSDVLGITQTHWVDEDRLASVLTPGITVSYTYDADGRRVSENDGNMISQYLIDPLLPYGQVIAEIDGGGQLVAEYVFGLDRISQRRSGTLSYYLADGQGSIRQLADVAGGVSNTYDYTAFGILLVSTGSVPNRFTYTGEEFDPNTGHYYLRARWMDPGTGRFLGIDPDQGLDSDPITLHRYLYAGMSPISFSDPSGAFFGMSNLSLSSVVQGTLQVISQAQMWTRYASFLANRAQFWALTNAIRIEFWSTAAGVAMGIATDLVNSGAEAILNNTTEYTGEVGGVVQEKMGANSTGYQLIDDYRNGQATSIKSSRRDMDGVLKVIRKEAITLSNRVSPYKPEKGSNQPPLPVTAARGVVMVIPEYNGYWLRNPAFVGAVREISTKTQVMVNVLPMRNWRPR